MSKTHLFSKCFRVAGLISSLIAGFGLHILPVNAHLNTSLNHQISKQETLVAQKFPENGDPKGRRRGGTSRVGNCPDIPVTALVPAQNNGNRTILVSTISEYPTFWVYIPKLPSQALLGEFVLQDSSGNDIWRTLITLTNNESIIPIRPPQKPHYALKQGSKYHWYFKVFCDEEKSNYVYVDAWLQRVALASNLQKLLKTSKALEYRIYAENKLWYDAMTALAKLRNNRINDISMTQEWNNLLNAMGLEQLIKVNILEKKISKSEYHI